MAHALCMTAPNEKIHAADDAAAAVTECAFAAQARQLHAELTGAILERDAVSASLEFKTSRFWAECAAKDDHIAELEVRLASLVAEKRSLAEAKDRQLAAATGALRAMLERERAETRAARRALVDMERLFWAAVAMHERTEVEQNLEIEELRRALSRLQQAARGGSQQLVVAEEPVEEQKEEEVKAMAAVKVEMTEHANAEAAVNAHVNVPATAEVAAAAAVSAAAVSAAAVSAAAVVAGYRGLSAAESSAPTRLAEAISGVIPAERAPELSAAPCRRDGHRSASSPQPTPGLRNDSSTSHDAPLLLPPGGSSNCYIPAAAAFSGGDFQEADGEVHGLQKAAEGGARDASPQLKLRPIMVLRDGGFETRGGEETKRMRSSTGDVVSRKRLLPLLDVQRRPSCGSRFRRCRDLPSRPSSDATDKAAMMHAGLSLRGGPSRGGSLRGGAAADEQRRSTGDGRFVSAVGGGARRASLHPWNMMMGANDDDIENVDPQSALAAL